MFFFKHGLHKPSDEIKLHIAILKANLNKKNIEIKLSVKLFDRGEIIKI